MNLGKLTDSMLRIKSVISCESGKLAAGALNSEKNCDLCHVYAVNQSHHI